jgi:hypothetical protein
MSDDEASPEGDRADSDGAGEPIPPQEMDRVFGVIEEAVADDDIEDSQLERLLSVLERTVASPSETDPEAVAELVSVLERVVVEPDDLEEANVDGVLSVLEEAVAGVTATDEGDISELFEVFETAVTDPTSIEPGDVERFRSAVEETLVEVTDPTGGVGGLFQLPGFAAVDPEEIDGEGETLDMFRLARVAAGMTQRATGYSVESGIRTGTRMAYAAATAESLAALVTETRAVALDELRRAGVDIGSEQTDWLEAHEDDLVDRQPLTREALRERGERLLSQSAEIGREKRLHPAFGSLLDELAADEARILRYLAREGAQPTITVHSRGYMPFRSQKIVGHLTMLGSDAGCRYTDRTPVYLQNLERLGLVEFAETTVENLKRYQVLEAQPHVGAAREAATRPKTDYGKVTLTDLGIDFCEACFPVTVEPDRRGVRFRRETDG